MKIELNTRYTVAELIIESDNTRIVEGISNYQGKCEGTEQSDLISAALEISRFNGESDVDFIWKAASQCLIKSDVEELIERLQEALV